MTDISKALQPGKKVTIKYGKHPVQWHDVYHIRGVIDGDRVVTKSWNPNKKRWDYKVETVHWFEMCDKDPDITVKVGNPTKAQQKKALREYVEAGIRKEFGGQPMTKARLKKIQEHMVKLVAQAREEGHYTLPEMPDPVISLHPEQDGQAAVGAVEMKLDIDRESLAESDRKWARRTGVHGSVIEVDEPMKYTTSFKFSAEDCPTLEELQQLCTAEED